jgi:thiol-disulfide isomerase/thioredoxin
MNTRTFLSLSLSLATAAGLCAWPQPAAAGEFPKGSPPFVTSFRKVLSDQKQTGKPAIVIFSASWCPPCQAMKKSVYPSDAVKPFHDKFIWAYLDTDEATNKKTAEKFSVNGIPHIEFLNAAGESIGQQVGGGSAADFAKKLEGILAKAAPAKKVAAR